MQADAAWLALCAREARFGGRLFLGSTSTGVQCAAVCRVRTPQRERCRFFDTNAPAQAAACRPCLKCRPESAPGLPNLDSSRGRADSAARSGQTSAAAPRPPPATPNWWSTRSRRTRPSGTRPCTVRCSWAMRLLSKRCKRMPIRGGCRREPSRAASVAPQRHGPSDVAPIPGRIARPAKPGAVCRLSVRPVHDDGAGRIDGAVVDAGQPVDRLG